MAELFSITKVTFALVLGIVGTFAFTSNLPSDAMSFLHSTQPEAAETQLVFVAAKPAHEFFSKPGSERRFQGIVQATRISTLAAQTLGRAEEVKIEIGQFVTTGQNLVELNRTSLQASVAQARAELSSAKAQLKKLQAGPRKGEIARALALVQEAEANVGMCQAEHDRVTSVERPGVISPRDLDNARFALSAAEATLKAAAFSHQLLIEGTRDEDILAQQSAVLAAEAVLQRCQDDLNNATIKAPFDGYVQSRLVEKGEVVQPGQPIVELVENQLQVHIALPPQVANKLAAGSVTASVRIDDQEIPSRLLALAPALNATTGTRLAKLSFDRVELNIASGESVEVSVHEASNGTSIWIPSEALSSQRGEWTIFVAHPTRSTDVFQTETMPVRVLKTEDNFSEIDVELEPERLVIHKGLHRIAPNQLVRVLQKSSDH
ncbi:MAG: efflux RND transporter periplasmic adaptor subunit [Planctomycetota bacterium]|nr:efflux RND transporter periplasmic adaptor subunit [Planctomycetota bacterium]